MSKSYYEKLKHPEWQKKRLEILKRDNFKCRFCGNSDKTLHIHHIIYRKVKNPWDYFNDELITLCKDCHKNETDTKQLLNDQICQLVYEGNMTYKEISDVLYCALVIKSRFGADPVELFDALIKDINGRIKEKKDNG